MNNKNMKDKLHQTKNLEKLLENPELCYWKVEQLLGLPEQEYSYDCPNKHCDGLQGCEYYIPQVELYKAVKKSGGFINLSVLIEYGNQ